MTRRSSSVTIRDVARQAGVSVATVSRYINRNAPVSTEVAERLNQVMTELRYVPHAAARNLASRKTRVIGLLLNNLHNDFFVPLLNGVEAVVRQKEYNLIVATYHANSRNAMPPPIGPHNTDGLLVFSDGLVDEDLANLNGSGFPMVLVHRTSPFSLQIPSVTVENTEITQRLVEHLIRDHGKRRILFMRGPLNQEDSNRREMGYKSALAANGIPFDEKLILNGEFERDIAFQALNEFLSNGKRVTFDAVFSGDDDAAIGVLKALHLHGFRIPEDVAVIGFDDLGFAPFLNPPLTTVRAPTEAVGRIATERLFDLLENNTAEEAVVLPTEIILRRSCGCEQ
ncbi:MAG TPA: LacI family DNA-binding transcriptional regulator [Anaerolineales bacterium]|nr:LacI family DNA-binding transcriptional regulator [Anaerolineales bacterium]